MAFKFYAVVRGRNPGIYDSWNTCQAEVLGFPKPIFKGFKHPEGAIEFMIENGAGEHCHHDPYHYTSQYMY